MERIKTPFDFYDIDDYINYIDELAKSKKKNNFDDESISHSDGRNTHNFIDIRRKHLEKPRCFHISKKYNYIFC